MESIREKSQMTEFSILSKGAALAVNSKGRTRPEPLCPFRTEFQRDRDRIIHSKAFRRLKHKTQVFVSALGDHYRTRLTHALEVSQIARTIARGLRLNEDLTEAAALGHDLGHTPFGHAGEFVLNELCSFGFEHNVHSVRVAEEIEMLNLTYETKDGILCHRGKTLPQTLEGMAVRLSDKIAYVNHDIEDAVRAELIRESDLPFDCAYVLGKSKSQRITTVLASIFENSTDEKIQMAPEVEKAHMQLREFMFEYVYNTRTCKSEDEKVAGMIRYMFEDFVKHPEKIPEEFRPTAEKDGIERAACDYIAGMTDTYAVSVFENMYIPKAWQK